MFKGNVKVQSLVESQESIVNSLESRVESQESGVNVMS